MTLSEIHTDEILRRREFPIVETRVFLAHAAVCPLPSRVVRAVQDYAAASATADQEQAWPAGLLQRTRTLAADLLGAGADEIAFVGSTSAGLSLVAAGLPWRAGDNVVIYDEDYPSNVYPWVKLRDRGVEVRTIQTPALGRIERTDVAAAIDAHTRLVALASCHFISGWRLDLEDLGSWLRSRGIWFCVDGIQTVGAFPTPADTCDFMAADAHKWMLGPCGTGILYVRSALQDVLQPSAWGWNNVHCPDFVAQASLTARTGGRRYEAGTYGLLGLAGLHAALALLDGVGLAAIASDLAEKRQRLIHALRGLGYRVLQADAPPKHAAGIVSFWTPDRDMGAVAERLRHAGVDVSLRSDRAGQRYVRLSPHFYNTEDELAHALSVLAGA
jgi:cysteine desulfurase / selenocysteine lyase